MQKIFVAAIPSYRLQIQGNLVIYTTALSNFNAPLEFESSKFSVAVAFTKNVRDQLQKT